MAWFGKKKNTEDVKNNDVELTAAEEKELQKAEKEMPSGMKETAQRMMSGNFDMNDMLAQLKQIKKMNNFSGMLKLVPGMKDAVGAMKEKVADGSVDKQIKILEAMTSDERNDPEKIFANAKARIAEKSGATVREVEHMIKQYLNMKRQMAMIQRMGGMDAMMEKMQGMKPGGTGAPMMPGAK